MSGIRQKKATEFILCAGCGGAAALLFDFPQIAVLLWGLLVPVFYVLLKNRGQTKVLAQCCGMFCAAFFMVYYAAFFTLDLTSRMGQTGIWALVGGYVVAVVLHGGMLFLALLTAMRIPCPEWMRAVLIALLWAGAEWLMGAGILGFPCMRLGISQFLYPPLIAGASLFGTLFIGFLMVMVNVLFAQMALSMRKKKSAGYFAVAVLVVCMVLLCGSFMHVETSGQAVTFAAVQYNMPSPGNEADARQDKALMVAGQAVAEHPRVLLLPENTIFGSLEKDAEARRPIKKLAEQSGGYVLTGVYGLHGFEMRNSIFMMDASGAVAKPYHKQRLVPFFENGYEQPFESEIGSDRGIFETEYGKIGTVICFESMFADVVADTVRQGAQVVCVLTNDSWFRGEVAMQRHFAHAVLRAAETGRYVVQVGNNGITGIVSPRGEVLQKMPANTDGYLLGEVEFLEGGTPYLWLGDVWILILAGVVTAIICVFRRWA